MVKKFLIGALVLVAIVAAPVLYFGYKFLQSGDTYGEDRQIADPQTLRRTKQGDVVGFRTSRTRIRGWAYRMRPHPSATALESAWETDLLGRHT